ncbi:hypothetical protein [Nocardia gipuzkoensis]
MLEEKCYICIHVFTEERPVLYACRDQDDLVMACGGADHRQDAEDWKVVHVGHLLQRDASLQVITDLRNEEQAERGAVGEPWLHGTIDD